MLVAILHGVCECVCVWGGGGTNVVFTVYAGHFVNSRVLTFSPVLLVILLTFGVLFGRFILVQNDPVVQICRWSYLGYPLGRVCRRARWFICGPRREKTCLRGFANNKVADKPVYPRSLISAFLIRLSECRISKLATGEISFF